MSYANQCLCCGAIIPEGLQVCPICEETAAGKAISKQECEWCQHFKCDRHYLIGQGNGMYDEVFFEFCPVCGRKLGGAE